MPTAGIDLDTLQGTGGDAQTVQGSVAIFTQAAAAVLYRSAVATPDVVAAPGTVTCTKLNGVGGLTANTYTFFVVSRNVLGRSTATQGNATVVTETTNLGARIAFAQVTGALGYDVYGSTDGSGAKFLARITEAQRASGGIITVAASGNTPATITAGGAVNSIDVYVTGVGVAVNSGQLAVNTAYVVPPSDALTPIDCAGYRKIRFYLAFSRTGDTVPLSALLLPFLKNSLDGAWYAGAPYTPSFGGATGNYDPLQQVLEVEVGGVSGVALTVPAIAGTGAAVDIRYDLVP